MGLEIQSKFGAPASQVGLALPSAPQVVSAVASPEKLAPALAPIKKAEIKVDPAELQKSLAQSIDRLNEMVRSGGRNLSFSIDHSLNAPIITVRNQETGEVIRQIPNEVVVQVAHSFDAMKGLLLNAKI